LNLKQQWNKLCKTILKTFKMEQITINKLADFFSLKPLCIQGGFLFKEVKMN